MIASMFYLPLAITDAAARLNFCVTTLKKACRLFGIDKWPYIKKLKRNLETMPPVAALCQTNSLLSQSPFEAESFLSHSLQLVQPRSTRNDLWTQLSQIKPKPVCPGLLVITVQVCGQELELLQCSAS
eukprot:2794678-Rhodomonas_salina.1